MKLLTFLGTAKYSDTIYTWNGQEHCTCFAPAASARFLDCSEVAVFLTEEAQEKTFTDFQAAMPHEIKIDAYPAALGKDEAELWQLFDAISNAVLPGDTVAFDITHGLRSFPLVGLLAAAFLRTGRKVDLKAVLYGAYEARTDQIHTPMFDLSPMVALLEWSAAADLFNRTGDSASLAGLIEKRKDEIAKAAGKDRSIHPQINNLGKLGSTLGKLSQSLALIRPEKATQFAAELETRILGAEDALEKHASTRPLALLLDQVAQVYSPLALKPGEVTVWEILDRERKIIHWYAKRDRWVQAATLAREWIVSWTMAQLGLPDLRNTEDREMIEYRLNAQSKKHQAQDSEYRPTDFHAIPIIKDVLQAWDRISKARNDINHAGMRKDPAPADRLVVRVKKSLEEIDKFPLL